MWPSLDAIAANLALAKNTMVFLLKRLRMLRVLAYTTVAHLGLVARAQPTAVHLRTGTGGAKVGAMALLDQLALVHLGRLCHPQFDRYVAAAAKQLGICAKVADVGH